MVNGMVKSWNRFFNRSKGTAELNAPIKSTAFVSVDLELTGLDDKRDSIVSIGAVKMAGGKILLTESFYMLVNPKIAFCGPSVTIHGITPADVCSQEGIEKVLREFIDFCGSDVVVGHCVEIDLAFLGRETRKLTGKPFTNPFIDTLALYGWLTSRHYPIGCSSRACGNSSLYEIAKHFAIPATIAHNAIMDAYITAQLFQRFISELSNYGVKNVGDLLRIGNPSKGGIDSITSGEIYNF
ncbi:MAG: 3'-5' exonuclease [Nitrospirae bacterium]|nr:3'-5' exonuclease [Nitrospirota bacterium]